MLRLLTQEFLKNDGTGINKEDTPISNEGILKVGKRRFLWCISDSSAHCRRIKKKFH